MAHEASIDASEEYMEELGEADNMEDLLMTVVSWKKVTSGVIEYASHYILKSISK